MPSSEQEYMETRSLQLLHRKRMFALISMLFFALAGSGTAIEYWYNYFYGEPTQETQVIPDTQASQLEATAKGYELVLQREPNNQTALEGLVQTRLKMNDTKGAIEPLEKLIKLHGDRKDYKILLEQIKQGEKSK